MKVIIKFENEGLGLDVQTLSVMSNLTFVTIRNRSAYHSLLMKLVKKGIVHSFEPKDDVIKVSIRTKYVDDID